MSTSPHTQEFVPVNINRKTMTEFAQKIGDICTTTAIGFALSICKDIGLLEVLVEADQPLTSQEIADKKKLKERLEIHFRVSVLFLKMVFYNN